MRAREQRDEAEAVSRAPAPATAARADSAAAPDMAGPLSPPAVLALQRAAGNAAVGRVLAAHRQEDPADGGRGQSVQRSSVQDVLRSPGRPMEDGLRTEMESRFGGADFQDVRVHSGAAAQRSTAELGAHAYTAGNHVVLGADGVNKHTVAHELTHVIQQRSGPVAGTDNGSGLRVSDPTDAFERAAEANAHRVMSGPVPAHTGREAARTAAGPVVQRDVHVQRYTDDAATGMRFSATGMYAFTVDGPTVWIREGAFVDPALRQVRDEPPRPMRGQTYVPYQLSRYVLNDCLHAAEELINNRVGQLAYGEGEYSRITTTYGQGTRSEKFGQSEQRNVQQARRYPGPSNHAAAPQPGQAFVILASDTGEEEMSPFHAAAVIGRDGNDCVTLEVWSSPGTSTAFARAYTIGSADASFHGYWENQYFSGTNALTVVLDPARAGDLVLAAVPQPANPAV
ncbi:DUF4157 domain-containing protein [Streptomyces sp. TRM 70351]|uniref:eCIS core domain-containing protein n=1 Tax=Streptomyces sp. TRM 70351 TaxID=3116552 RepID=UPI002E7AD05B|nr:DUF4157 domain-containing protein [Streptomyces sp. TRM 70351]MEE1928485.1 DUF4157 domain-containing protein [Streptomyces sp. TRM 70351]